jgi:hypothetical protein
MIFLVVACHADWSAIASATAEASERRLVLVIAVEEARSGTKNESEYEYL